MSVDVPESLCPNCGKRSNAATDATSTEPAVVPKAGDVSICLYCSAVTCYGEDLTLHAMTMDDLIEVLKDPRVEDAIRASALYRKLFGEAKAECGNKAS